MDIDQLKGYHEIVFGSQDPHIVVHHNTQTDNYANHWHTPMEILMPVENHYTAYVNGRKYELQPYDILIVAPNVYHAYEAPDTGMRYFILIDVSILKDILGIHQVLSLLNPCACFTAENAPEIHTLLKKHILDICHSYFESFVTTPVCESDTPLPAKVPPTPPVPEIDIYRNLLDMFSIIARQNKASDTSGAHAYLENQTLVNKFTFICSFIDDHCTEALSLEQVSKMMNFSKYHFSRLFKEFTGESFYRYVNIKRIQYAERLLVHQSTSVTDIALTCGYSTTSAFIRMFKQINGCTPRDFRERRKHSKF